MAQRENQLNISWYRIFLYRLFSKLFISRRNHLTLFGLHLYIALICDDENLH